VLLSDLLDLDVLDGDGTRLGRVKDVRLVQDGPLLEGFGHALRVEGIVTGRGAIAVRLGFERAGVRGPWPLTTIFRRLERHARYYDWSDVAAWDADGVRLRVGATPRTMAELVP
jgi:hypothetical protein